MEDKTFLTYPKDNQIHRIEYKSNGYVNVTEMAKIFGKDQYDFFRNKIAIEYIEALSRSTGIPEPDLKYTIMGGNQRQFDRSGNSRNGKFAENRLNGSRIEQGTFCHPKLAIRFAQWLNADFAVWVDGKVLEILGYSKVANDIEDPKYLVAKALIAASKMIEEKDAEILELKPKADFADYIHSNPKTYSFREAAKLLGFKDIGEKTLFQFCRDQQFLMLNNEPYQTYMAQGLFKQVTEKFEKASGDQGVYLKTVITGKGLDIVSKKLSEKGYSRVNEFVLEEALLV